MEWAVKQPLQLARQLLRLNINIETGRRRGIRWKKLLSEVVGN